ncbi:succinate CoA transferase [Paramuribaculum intestinale]|uniref:succinate CoA transferase n=1 Tax=Paramuribaculum intestinale TaxID=2094151 RepID=UPI0025A9C82F|nr:succinate CoA transferase [Paramuribaculum intestinale]
MAFPILSAQEAAELIKNGDNIGLSGFTASGSPKVITEALAAKAVKEHEAGRPFKVSVFTGASTNNHADGALARANAIARRTPYQNTPDLRLRINSHDCHYFDLHLSELAQKFRYNTYGELDWAILEVAKVFENGEVVLGTGVGNVPTYAAKAKKILLELNTKLPEGLYGLHDIYMPLDPPHRREIPIYTPSDRIGHPTVKIDPSKIAGIIHSDAYDGIKGFTALDDTTLQIGANVCNFLIGEVRAQRIPQEFLPIQSGVGNVANAVLFGLGDAKELPPFAMYTEVIQDAVIDLMRMGRCKFGSTCSLTLSDAKEAEVLDDLDFFRDKIVIRPAEISNSPEVIRRLGVIAMNTALEADIFGNINSTHVVGTRMMNGIGGSGDFTRNGYLSIFSCPSITKGGLISNIVPMCSHIDHTEHSVDVIITEQGVADVRGLDPVQRAERIIDNCAHPMYKELLRDYLKLGKGGQTPHHLAASLGFHTAFQNTGDMRLTDWSQYA